MELLKKYIINSSFTNWQRNGWQRSAWQKRCTTFAYFFRFCSTLLYFCSFFFFEKKEQNIEANKNKNMKRELFTTAKILIIIISLTLGFYTLFIYLLSWSTIRFIWNLGNVYGYVQTHPATVKRENERFWCDRRCSCCCCCCCCLLSCYSHVNWVR